MMSGFFNGDSKHEIIDLECGAELHRFLNGAGEPYSAIYVGSFEKYSCEREREDGMLNFFRAEVKGEQS